MQRFIRLMAVDHHTSIIDVGGTPFIWQFSMAINRVSAVGPDDQCVNAMIDRENRRMVLASGMGYSVSGSFIWPLFSNSQSSKSVMETQAAAHNLPVRICCSESRQLWERMHRPGHN